MGCGRVGSTLARSLEDRGHTVAVIDSNPDAFRRLGPGFEGEHGHRHRLRPRRLLEAAGIEDADAFAAVSSGDNSNILSARVARETFGVDNVVARIYDPGRAEVYQRLGIPTVATVRWTADQMLRRLLPHGAEPEWRDPSGTIRDRGVSRRRPVDRPPARPSSRRHRRPRRLPDPARRGRARRRPTWCSRTATSCTWSIARRPTPTPSTRRIAGRPGGAALMRVVIAGAGSVGRSVAARAARERPPGAAHRQGPRRHPGRRRARRRVAARRRLRALVARRGGAAASATSWSPRPVTTRPTWSSRCWPRPSSRVPRTVARVNNPANEWMFDESWGVDVVGVDARGS